ncbi:MAG: glycosyltransferase [Kiritimatiellae bacterium]|nr:glycosyltransferase [Kiritimatiellia bacterium]
MKTALLHYWLTNMRGGEKVLAALGEMFPDADVFTHAYIPEKVPCFNRFRVKETFISCLPFGRRHPQVYLPLMPAASRSLDLSGYDLILSSESGPIKGVRKPEGARHICYCHTPMRYLWDMYDEYYRSAGFGGRMAMKLFAGRLRREDLKSAETVDEFVANSAFVAGRIRRIYNRESTVVHPPVDVEFFGRRGELPAAFGLEPKSYYLYAGELRDYKRPDLAVEACLRMGRRLVVVGAGGMRDELSKRARGGEGIVFLGRITDAELRGVFANARALLFPGTEDFGIVPVEAQAAGTPVIAFGRGGALETVAPGVSGCFFEEETAESLCRAIEEFESRAWSAEACAANARRFSGESFVRNMAKVIRGRCDMI